MGPKSSRGFTLPDGDKAARQETYVRLGCNACHSISGVDQLQPDEGEPDVSVALGGEVGTIKTYGQLVTSIINPSHRFALGYKAEDVQTAEGESKMRLYNDEMTVTELTDIVSFVQSKYSLRPYEPTEYSSSLSQSKRRGGLIGDQSRDIGKRRHIAQL